MGLWIHRNTQMWSVALRVSEPKGGNIQGHGRIITQQSIAPSTVQRVGGHTNYGLKVRWKLLKRNGTFYEDFSLIQTPSWKVIKEPKFACGFFFFLSLLASLHTTISHCQLVQGPGYLCLILTLGHWNFSPRTIVLRLPSLAWFLYSPSSSLQSSLRKITCQVLFPQGQAYWILGRFCLTSALPRHIHE